MEADVNYSVAKRFANRVKEKALGQEVLSSVKPGQLLVKITQEELADFTWVDSTLASTSRASHLWC